MADKKISELPVATTPLGGGEELAVVQSGATKKVSVNNLTDGKAVSALSVTATNIKTSPATANLDVSGSSIVADGTDADIDINITPKGTGEVNLPKVDIDAGTIDGTTIATSDITVGAGKTLDVSAGTLTLANDQISGDSVEGGTINATTINTLTSTTVNGTTFDTNVAAAGVTLSGVTLSADGTDADIDINITPKGTGEVNLPKVDIDAGAIDGTAIGASSASTGTFTTLSATTVSDGAGSVRIIPATGAKTTSYTLATGDVGKYVEVGSGGSITIPNNTFAAGDAITIYNNTTGSITITCTITTAYISGTNTDKASVSLATRGVATILFISGTLCVISGSVS